MRPKYPWVLFLLLGVAGVAGVIWQASRATKKGPPPEEYAATFDHKFRCTIYYTPKLTGFSAREGFDMTMETRSGLKEHRYPRDFLLAIEKEGFGKINEPQGGMNYIRYWSGGWGFAEAPIDHNQRPLMAKSSCAVSGKQKLLPPQARLKILALNAPQSLEQWRWIVADTGSGLDEEKIDLYWGEDDPLGPGKKLNRPKSAPADFSETTVWVCK